MSRSLKGITLHEGYNDIGSFDVNITDIEEASVAITIDRVNQQPLSAGLLFRLRFVSGAAVPQNYKGVFTVKGRVEAEDVEFTAFPNPDGYLRIDTPTFPVVRIKTEEDIETVISLSIHGALAERAEECYIEVLDMSSASRYTLIWDICVHEGFLTVADGHGNYYNLATSIEVPETVTALHVTEKGVVFGFNAGAPPAAWTELGTLEFTTIEFPENLTSAVDGFYETTDTTGTVTTGTLGDGDFADYKSSVLYPELYLVNVDVEVFAWDDSSVYTHSFTNRMPGSLDFIPVNMEGSALSIPDESPTLEEIETISGVTFSDIFSNFLTTHELTTLDKIRKAGPLKFLNDYPIDGVTANELKTLQGHVDLYSINQDIAQNQRMISRNWNTILGIAFVPRKMFLDSVVDGTLPLFRAAQIHEVAVQNQRLASNLLAGVLADLQHAVPATPELTDSKFVESAFPNIINSCGCDDCKSAISPFAYLLDLIKYGAGRVKHTVPTYFSPGQSTANFVALLSSKFFQPFNTLAIDCKTLHDEFCRVRLVTEVLEQIVVAFPPSAARLSALTIERNQFLSLVYQTVLLQAGSSLNEVRDVYLMQVDKLTAAQTLADKLGIPLYIPGTTDYTTDVLWLTLGNAITAHQITATNLETVFGFRNTKRNVLTNTPVSYIETWHAAFLRNLWKTQDYMVTGYSREDVDAAVPATFKTSWLPIIDPDIIGWGDMTYYGPTAFKALWENRKKDTDHFLSYYVNDAAVVADISVDMSSLIARVIDRDLSSQVIENNEVFLLKPAVTPTWEVFKAIKKQLVEAHTDITLSLPVTGYTNALFQPVPNSKMRYKKVVDVATATAPGTPTIVVITFAEPVIFDLLSAGYARFESSGLGTVPYETSPPGISPDVITAIVVNSLTQVTLTLGTAMSVAFSGGNLKFIFEAEVPLYNTTTIDVPLLIEDLFIYQGKSYIPLTPAVITNPYLYSVWHEPTGWATPSTYYGRLQSIYQQLSAGITTNELIITDDLHLSFDDFNRMMELLDLSDKYLKAMYTSKRPTMDELYELASIFRVAARTQLNAKWVQEEITYIETGTDPIVTRLDSQYFWKALNEPASAPWDPSLQTIPTTVGAINLNVHTPIVDPQLLQKKDMLINPEAKPYLDLYDLRKGLLDAHYDAYLAKLIPYTANGFTQILNDINTGAYGTAFTITGYATLADLITDLKSYDSIKNKKAADALWLAFGIMPDLFLEINRIKDAYENVNATLHPANSDLAKAVTLLVPGYKRIRLYTNGLSTGWIDEEIEGTFAGGGGVMLDYYNVLNMRLAPRRADIANRRLWQQTLEAWNRQPFIQPDLMPPENIIDFISTNPVYITWNARKVALDGAYTTLASTLNAGVANAGTLLNNLQDQIALIVQRSKSFAASGTAAYLHYFTDIKTVEEAGDDIRPILEQLGIAIAEYRFLANIYHVLEITPGASASPLVPSEYDDVINILIAIRSRNLPFTQVVEEYNTGIILDQDYFRDYKPALLNFPLSDLPVYNAWRSPHRLKKDLMDTLNTRIDMEQGISDRWHEVLQETEDRNMPLMRDALIRSLTPNCVAWQDMAEQLAKTYFIETKDNCCVKHTRVSFAIETLQGFYFSLQNGIYSGFIADFKLFAPDFEKEWQWMGSYATWRAAIFVYIYPENLLYPTLKRLQSPAFRKLAQTLQTANRFSPLDACDAAKEYQVYLDDISNLSMCFSANAKACYMVGDPNDCCSGEVKGYQWTSYFFGQGKSGTSYISSKLSHDNSKDAPGFWEELPIRKNAKLLGCHVSCLRGDPNFTPFETHLMIFYTYSDKGKFKVSFIEKDVLDPKGKWSEEIETDDLPELPGQIQQVTACQQSIDWDLPSFTLSYEFEGKYFQTYSTYNRFSEKWYVPKYEFRDITTFGDTDAGNDVTDYRYYSYTTQTLSLKPLTVINFNLEHPYRLHTMLVYVFEDGVFIQGYDDKYNSNLISFDHTHFDKIIGGFKSDLEDNTVIIINKYSATNINLIKIKISSTGISTNEISITDVLSYPIIGPGINTLDRVYPVFRQNGSPWLFAIRGYFSNNLIGGQFYVPPNVLVSTHILNAFALSPENTSLVAVESAECIDDMKDRTLNIKDIMKSNMNSSQGTSVSNILRSAVVREVIAEAYYFVPMLLALDQQRRGEYTAALSWYRSIYDYTLTNGVARKIYYGLVLEQSISNVYTQASNWLLDPLNPHLVAQTRAYAYSQYTIINIVQCLYSYADREFTLDTIETVPVARKLYTTALELLKVNDLNLKPIRCIEISQNCLNTQTDLANDPKWGNLYGELKEKYRAVGNADIMESIEEGLVDLLNSGTEDTYADVFSQAFDMVKAARPAPTTPKTIAQRLQSFITSVNYASSYLFALNDQREFSEQVAANFAFSVAGISGVDLDEVSTPGVESRISWLQAEVPDNTQPYEFRFADENGKQLMPADRAFDPLKPGRVPVFANGTYTNAPVEFGHVQYINPRGFVPLVDYGFCLPQNPVYQSLVLKGNLELYKIFNCRNIAGMVRELSVYAAATDSTSGMPFIGASGNLVTPGIGNYTPSQYRFRVLVERAKQIVAQAQHMESLFLAALEKEDVENYSQLRAKQDLQTAKATVKLQDLRIHQASDEVGAATIQLDKVTFTQQHFDELLSAGLNSFEADSLSYLKTSMTLSTAVSIGGLASAVGAAFDTRSGAASIGALVLQAGQVAAQIFSQLATINLQLASYARRAEEWTFQKDLAGFDISLANQQIKISQDNVRIVTQEREIASMNVDHAQDSLEFLKTKFTNAELYNFMGNVLERSYSYMLNLGTATARIAEGQLYFERQEQAGPFILDDYWELPSSGSGGSTDRRGLTGSARLAVDITRLDQYAFETNKRKLQLTKVISLAQNFPSEFQHFKETGVLNFSLTNKQFDYDFPGHYLRLINSVKTSVVGLIPVYDGIKATLTAGATSYTVIGGNIFQRIPIKRNSIDSVALTSPNNASGLFELQQTQGELLNPFENMGIESQWEFKMPQFSNRMDFGNIADILFTVEYTALDSFQYRTQVLQDLDNSLSFNRAFSFKNDFPDQWYELGEAQTSGVDFGVTFELKRDMFPQGIQNLKLNHATGMLLYFIREDGFVNEISVRDFNLSASANAAGGTTVNGIFRPQPSVISGNSPLLKLRLRFTNTPIMRDLFADGSIRDIILLIGCKAELTPYPL